MVRQNIFTSLIPRPSSPPVYNGLQEVMRPGNEARFRGQSILCSSLQNNCSYDVGDHVPTFSREMWFTDWFVQVWFKCRHGLTYEYYFHGQLYIQPHTVVPTWGEGSLVPRCMGTRTGCKASG